MSTTGIVLIAALVAVVFFVLWVQYGLTSGLLRREKKRAGEMLVRLSSLILSSEFEEADSGLVQGRTKDSLSDLERSVLAAREKAEALQLKLEGSRAKFLSLFGKYSEAKKLQYEGNEIANQLDRFKRQMLMMEKAADEARRLLEQARRDSEEVAKTVEEISRRTRYPLDDFRNKLERIDGEIRKAGEANLFDAVQAKEQAQETQTLIADLQVKTTDFEKNVGLLDDIKRRIDREAALLKARIEKDDSLNANRGLLANLKQVELMIADLEAMMSRGETVNLRAAAVDIDRLLKDTTYTIEGVRY
ncbi:coiled-coil domain-containing protein [Cohnella fermenti]|uniref:Uncharacterized protein n=1 Tax=Cohnella fermenti TaxID=2565925 RepID=A0A4S4BGX8_9BACL|nr:hypothetical protein [Cohnella fermenti]THF73730.1 hypothetical protein E6C55_27965 [Cohnella fermenti]